MFLALFLGLVAAADGPSERETTRIALERLEDVLQMRLDDGRLSTKDILPAIIVEVEPFFEESKNGYPTAALASLTRVLPAEGLRLCEACMSARTFVGRTQLEQSVGPISVEDIIRLDETLRGNAAPARSAIWLSENVSGVSLRIVELGTSRIILAENIDPELEERARTTKNFSMAHELDRRARGDSLTHTFIDFAMYPQQHFSIDWTEQWGDANNNLSGLTLSIYDPIVGIGGAYYRIIPEAFKLCLGVKVIMSVPTALARSVGGDIDVIDPILTGIFALRIPLFDTNYGLFFSGSTNGRIGVGLSSMNMTVLPVIP